jgi:hypothetical protein
VRIYLLAAGQHGPGAFPPTQTIGQQRNNPLDYRYAMKALLLAMDRWTMSGASVAPPPSRYPRVADGTLVPPDRLRFPKLAGVTTSTAVHRAYRVDYGPSFATNGSSRSNRRASVRRIRSWVLQVDADGTELPA